MVQVSSLSFVGADDVFRDCTSLLASWMASLARAQLRVGDKVKVRGARTV